MAESLCSKSSVETIVSIRLGFTKLAARESKWSSRELPVQHPNKPLPCDAGYFVD